MAWYSRILIASVPACIAFGPFFMIGGGGSAPSGTRIDAIGAFMTAVGLCVLFWLVMKHQKLIEELQSSIRADKKSEEGSQAAAGQ